MSCVLVENYFYFFLYSKKNNSGIEISMGVSFYISFVVSESLTVIHSEPTPCLFDDKYNDEDTLSYSSNPYPVYY